MLMVLQSFAMLSVSLGEDTTNLLQSSAASRRDALKSDAALSWIEHLSQSPDVIAEKFASLPQTKKSALIQEMLRLDPEDLARSIDSMPESQRERLALAMRRMPFVRSPQGPLSEWVSALQQDAASIDGALSDKGNLNSAVSGKSQRGKSDPYQAGPGIAVEGYVELLDDGKSGACRYMDGGVLSKGSCGSDFQVPTKDGGTTCLNGTYGAQTPDVIATLQTASSPRACAELCEKTVGCTGFEMSGGSLEETKCEVWSTTPTLSQHSSTRPHWCYVKQNYQSGPGMSIEGYTEILDNGKSGACRYMDNGNLSKGSCGSDFQVPTKDGSTTCLTGTYGAQTPEVIATLQTSGSPQGCADLCARTPGCTGFEMSGGKLEETKCEVWTTIPTLSQHSSSRPHWCYTK